MAHRYEYSGNYRFVEVAYGNIVIEFRVEESEVFEPTENKRIINTGRVMVIECDYGFDESGNLTISNTLDDRHYSEIELNHLLIEPKWEGYQRIGDVPLVVETGSRSHF